MDQGHSLEGRRRRRRRSRTEEAGGEVPAFSEQRFVRSIGDMAVVVVFFAVLVVAPLPMGGNRDWAWAPMILPLAAACALCAVGLGYNGGFSVSASERWPLLLLIACFAGMIGVALLQMSGLVVTPGSAQIYARARELLGQTHRPTVSLAVDAERNALLRCVATALLFLLARAICHDERRARLLLIALVLSGLIVMGYALLMNTTVASCYIGSYLKKEGEFLAGNRCVMSGTFVNSNSFGCFMGMGVVAALALFGGQRQPAADDEAEERDGDRALGWVTGPRIMLSALALFMLGGILIAKSRAGLAATILGVGLLGYLRLRGRGSEGGGSRRAMIAAAAVVGVVMIAIAGNTFWDKLSKLSEIGSLDRFYIWRATIDAIRLSPWLGWGLGSFADIYSVLQRFEVPIVNDLAHSTPLEFVAELGIPGALAAFGVVLVPWIVSWRGSSRRASNRYLPAGAFAVAAVAILHSVVDFSLQMPAIGFWVSALLGMGWAQAFAPIERVRRPRSSRRRPGGT